MNATGVLRWSAARDPCMSLRYVVAGMQVPQSQFDLYSWVTDDEPDCNATAPVIWPGQTTGYSCRRQGWALLGMMDTGA